MQDLTITQGDEKTYNLTFTSGGEPLDITGATLKMTAKRSLGATLPDLEKTVTEHTNPTEGKTVLTLTEENTSKPLGSYYYDVQISGGSVPKKTVMRGKLSIVWQVTED